MPDFLDPFAEIKMHGAKLPHWQQEAALQFVTIRLGDSLPETKLKEWRENRDTFLKLNPKPWTPEKEREFHRRTTLKIEEWLDQNHGSCLFRETQHRKHLAEILMKFQDERVIHESWVIMPNHLHLLFKPLAPLEALMKAWKSTFAHQLGQGSIWQKNYRDTLIRDEKHFTNAVRYIRKNPRHLEVGSFTLWESERAMQIE